MEGPMTMGKKLIILTALVLVAVGCSRVTDSSGDNSLFAEFDNGLNLKVSLPSEEQQSPNTIEISFVLPRDGSFELLILNATGYTVNEYRGNSEAGTVRVEWDMTNKEGVSIHPGIFVFEINAGSYQARDVEVILEV